MPNYEQKKLTEIFANRVPRLAETIMPSGFGTNPSSTTAFVAKPTFGGYLQVKFYPRDPALRGGSI
jgi:hypothetical protein